jgi:hypothetical protein
VFLRKNSYSGPKNPRLAAAERIATKKLVLDFFVGCDEDASGMRVLRFPLAHVILTAFSTRLSSAGSPGDARQRGPRGLGLIGFIDLFALIHYNTCSSHHLYIHRCAYSKYAVLWELNNGDVWPMEAHASATCHGDWIRTSFCSSAPSSTKKLVFSFLLSSVF